MIQTTLKHVANVDDQNGTFKMANVDDQNGTFKMIGTILKYDFKIED